MSKVINLSEFAKELGAWSESHIVELKAGALAGVARSIPDLVAASPVDTGLYAQSWNFTETETSVILGNYAPYAPIIEYGSRPGHRVPIQPLLAWAKRVLGDPSQPPNYSPAVRGLAYGTQKKIFDRGTLPKAVLQNAMPMILENIKKEWEARLG
jgi:hypothetical protein